MSSKEQTVEIVKSCTTEKGDKLKGDKVETANHKFLVAQGFAQYPAKKEKAAAKSKA